jgi:hypothetical protein
MSIQLKLTVLGIAQRIAHNLARYHSKQSRAYTVVKFKAACIVEMERFDIPTDTQRRIMRKAEHLMIKDLVAIKHGLKLNSHGSSECTAKDLLEEPLESLMKLLPTLQTN